MEKWVIDKDSERTAKASISNEVAALKKWNKFQTVVTANPFFHPKHKRIVKLKATTYPTGTYRYKDEPLRVVYYPDKKHKIVYPLEAATATKISYKRRSSR